MKLLTGDRVTLRVYSKNKREYVDYDEVISRHTPHMLMITRNDWQKIAPGMSERGEIRFWRSNGMQIGTAERLFIRRK